MAKKSKISPSRKRYEENNPTVSARLPKLTRDKLLANLLKLGMTLRDAFMALAGELEIKTKPLDEARREGYQRGYEEARKKYAVIFPCSVCGELILLQDPEAKMLVARFLTDQRWGHLECHQQAGSS